MAGLPFGRPPTQPPQTQFIDERRRSLPRQIEGWVSIGSPYSFVDAGTVTADRLIIQILDYLPNAVTVDTARIVVTTNAASSTARAGIYVRDGLVEPSMHLVPGTSVIFDTSTTGTKDVTLTRAVTLNTEARYYMAYVVTSGTVAIASISNTTGAFGRRFKNSVTSLPESLDFTSTGQGTGTVPGVVYYHSNLL